jgi:uncharacterized protein YxeA
MEHFILITIALLCLIVGGIIFKLMLDRHNELLHIEQERSKVDKKVFDNSSVAKQKE